MQCNRTRNDCITGAHDFEKLLGVLNKRQNYITEMAVKVFVSSSCIDLSGCSEVDNITDVTVCKEHGDEMCIVEQHGSSDGFTKDWNIRHGWQR